jgi:hypothetical protein
MKHYSIALILCGVLLSCGVRGNEACAPADLEAIGVADEAAALTLLSTGTCKPYKNLMDCPAYQSHRKLYDARYFAYVARCSR